jgi:hypothetical protein
MLKLKKNDIISTYNNIFNNIQMTAIAKTRYCDFYDNEETQYVHCIYDYTYKFPLKIMALDYNCNLISFIKEPKIIMKNVKYFEEPKYINFGGGLLMLIILLNSGDLLFCFTYEDEIIKQDIIDFNVNDFVWPKYDQIYYGNFQTFDIFKCKNINDQNTLIHCTNGKEHIINKCDLLISNTIFIFDNKIYEYDIKSCKEITNINSLPKSIISYTQWLTNKNKKILYMILMCMKYYVKIPRVLRDEIFKMANLLYATKNYQYIMPAYNIPGCSNNSLFSTSKPIPDTICDNLI